ncbi:MAG: endonuclease/exonuclease/phosphatase family protein [Isosphaeraceae bacterium]
MRLISWNVAGRVRRLPDQVEALRRRRPDVVALQEVRKSTVEPLTVSLRSIGLEHVGDSLSGASNPELLKGPRSYGQLIASRWPLNVREPTEFRVPWTERILSADIERPGGGIEIHTVHVPPGSTNDWIKIETFEGVFDRLAVATKTRRILCGDFNSPKAETPDGETITWGQKQVGDRFECWGKWRGGSGEDWDRAERSVLRDLADFDLADVYRNLHGFEREDFSWYLRRKGRSIGRRFDHVFASRALHPTGCRYLHFVREGGLSDHSALEVEFAG